MDLCGRSYLKDGDLDRGELTFLLDLAQELRSQRREGLERRRLEGMHIALLFEKTSTRTRAAFEVAAGDQGARVTYMGPGETQFGVKESVRDTARVLGRMFDGIAFRGFRQTDAEILAAHCGVPVWNALTDEWHPTQSLADLLTIRDHAKRTFNDVSVCFVGDAANNTCASLLTAGALVGMDVRIAAPHQRRPSPDVWIRAEQFARRSGGSLMVTDDPDEAVAGADFVYTDVWLSIGEPDELWAERIDLLAPYQVSSALMAASGNRDIKLLHCLPAYHDSATQVAEQVHRRMGITEMEVTDEVFESGASVVFDQAENRLHTIKALMVATLSGPTLSGERIRRGPLG